jgi:hypothetical protein
MLRTLLMIGALALLAGCDGRTPPAETAAAVSAGDLVVVPTPSVDSAGSGG